MHHSIIFSFLILV